VTTAVGPSSILLALDGQRNEWPAVSFAGYLPLIMRKNERAERTGKRFMKRNSTQIFIETPYRNNQLLKPF
jgi:16S rRNA (cytidine1402-2'-O)-methyltransferase